MKEAPYKIKPFSNCSVCQKTYQIHQKKGKIWNLGQNYFDFSMMEKKYFFFIST